jgi:heme A synthase
VLAVAAGLVLLGGGRRLARGRGETAGRFARAVSFLVTLQVLLGMINVILLAPVWLQLVHLFVADAVWISLILLGAEVLADSVGVRTPQMA